jgi:hypothetical protein
MQFRTSKLVFHREEVRRTMMAIRRGVIVSSKSSSWLIIRIRHAKALGMDFMGVQHQYYRRRGLAPQAQGWGLFYVLVVE